MNVHALKCWPVPFTATWSGLKPYEVRVDDRGFSVGDVLNLFEWDPKTSSYSGRLLIAVVTFKTPGGDYGLPTNLCVLGTRVVHRIESITAAARAA